MNFRNLKPKEIMKILQENRKMSTLNSVQRIVGEGDSMQSRVDGRSAEEKYNLKMVYKLEV